MSINTLASTDCALAASEAATLRPVHEFELEHNTRRVRAKCITCDWKRFGAWYPEGPEGRALAKQDGEMHLSDPDTPAFTPAGW